MGSNWLNKLYLCFYVFLHIKYLTLKVNVLLFVTCFLNVSDSNSISKSCIKFTLESLLECLNYLIDNAYIIFDGNVYRQSIGIPMGTNAGPHVANIYVHQYENDYFNYLYINNMKGELSKLQHVFRFQDDLISFNDHGYL